MNFDINNWDKESLNTEIISQKSFIDINTSFLSSQLSILSKNHLNKYIYRIKILIISISFFQGLMDILNLSLFYFEKDKLKLNPSSINIIAGIIQIPWCIKPIFGYFSDKIRLKFGGIKPILWIISTLDFIFLILNYFLKPNLYIFVTILFFHNICLVIEIIVAETLLIILSKQQIKEGFEGESGKNISFFFASKCLGSIFGNLFSGSLILVFKIEFIFLISSLFPLFIILICFSHKEIIINNDLKKENNDIKKDFKEIFQIIKIREIFILLLVVFLINSAPDFNSLVLFYFTNILKFTSIELSYFSTLGTIFYFLGIIFYNIYFKDINQKSFYIITNFILFFSSIFFFLILGGFLDNFNLNKKILCFLNECFQSFISEINMMPILIILCEWCPDNLEGSSFAFFTSIWNFSSIISNYFGFLLLYIFKINKNKLNNIWIPLLIQNIYYFIFILILIFIKFPNPLLIINNLKSKNKELL